jgi:hypothetical protein
VWSVSLGLFTPFVRLLKCAFGRYCGMIRLIKRSRIISEPIRRSLVIFAVHTGMVLCCFAENHLPAPVFRTGNALEITLEPSRAQPTAGSVLQITGVVKNVSDTPVAISEHCFTITVPGEIDQINFAGGYYARLTVNDFDQYNGMVILAPGQSTNAYWRVNADSSFKAAGSGQSRTWYEPIREQLNSELGYLFFSPGDYKFSVQAKFWPLSNGATITREELRQANYDLAGYQTAVASTSIRVAAPITVILVGAAIGGLLAFTLKRSQSSNPLKVRGHEPAYASILRGFAAAAGAVLLSCISTILLSRLADTQFPIRISISDLWGAIAIGFIAAYSGSALLEKYLGSTSAGAQQPRPTETDIRSGLGTTEGAEDPHREAFTRGDTASGEPETNKTTSRETSQVEEVVK